MNDVTPPPVPTMQDLITALTAALGKPAAPAAPSTSALKTAVADVEAEITKLENAAGVVQTEFASTRSFFGSAHGLTRVAEWVIGGFALVGVAAIASNVLHAFKVL